MSFSGLRDIFIGRLGADYCVRSVLFLKSPKNVKEYLVGIHKITFPDGDKSKNKRWHAYHSVTGTQNVIPIREKDLSNVRFMNKQANKLSFDISRFIEFLSGYTKADEDIKPIMLHYAMIYLFDFFSRSWLKYERNWSHGIWKLKKHSNDFSVRIGKNGIFPRVVDAFYLLYQSNLFSLNDADGIVYPLAVKSEVAPNKIQKMKYSERPEIKLSHLFDIYEKLGQILKSSSKSNSILVGYVILFIISSISRYRAEDWFKVREDKDQRNKIDLLQYDFLYEWTPEILQQTILKKGLKKELSISSD